MNDHTKNILRNTVIQMVDSGITNTGLYRTLNREQINRVRNYNWENNPEELIIGKTQVVVMNYNGNLYAISFESDTFRAFYRL